MQNLTLEPRMYCTGKSSRIPVSRSSFNFAGNRLGTRGTKPLLLFVPVFSSPLLTAEISIVSALGIKSVSETLLGRWSEVAFSTTSAFWVSLISASSLCIGAGVSSLNSSSPPGQLLSSPTPAVSIGLSAGWFPCSASPLLTASLSIESASLLLIPSSADLSSALFFSELETELFCLLLFEISEPPLPQSPPLSFRVRVRPKDPAIADWAFTAKANSRLQPGRTRDNTTNSSESVPFAMTPKSNPEKPIRKPQNRFKPQNFNQWELKRNSNTTKSKQTYVDDLESKSQRMPRPENQWKRKIRVWKRIGHISDWRNRLPK